jgi:microcystin-dependent protein
MANKSAFEISKGFSPESIRSRNNYRRDGHGFETGQVVYFDGAASEWKLADWLYYNLTGSSEALGIIDKIDEFKFDVVYRGSISIPIDTMVRGTNFGSQYVEIKQNTVYFLSQEPGMLTEFPPQIDLETPKVRKPILVTLSYDGENIQKYKALVVNYRGYVEDTEGCVAFVQNIIPIGTIEIITSGEKTPDDWKDEGWLLCDGKMYSKEEYKDLFNVIGNAYGSLPSQQNDKFKVPDFNGRIMIGKPAGVPPGQTAYGGNDNIVIHPEDTGPIAGEGQGNPKYNPTSNDKNKQAVYHANFYIRAKNPPHYLNVETCNNAGGSIKNKIGNGAFNVWQRGTSFNPDPALTGTDHLADLNRYTADRWFRKVGFCPQGMGATGTGSNSHSEYIGKCNRKSFKKIDTTIPDVLSKQYPDNYMEYQSFISGPGADTSLEYCILENRIGDVKTLSGETVCVSFWARSNTPGLIFVNLKQHFGYDKTSTALSSTSTGVTDRTTVVPNNSQIEYIKNNSSLINPGGISLPDEIITLPPNQLPSNLLWGRKPVDKFLIAKNKIYSSLNFAENIVQPAFANRENLQSIAVDCQFSCTKPSGMTSCSNCELSLSKISFNNFTIFNANIPNEKLCTATANGYGSVSVPQSETTTSSVIAVPLAEASYKALFAFVNGTKAFPISVKTAVITHIQNFVTETNNNYAPCRCMVASSSTNNEPPPPCDNINRLQNYDATLTLGSCCVMEIESGVISYQKIPNQTVHHCTELGGQFISNDALDYFNALDTHTCGVSEDMCSDGVIINVDSIWQQYEVVFNIPSVDSKYIGNSNTDYLALQLWTHLSNGYCKTNSDVQVFPRNRLGENYGTVDCSENSLCEPCVSNFSYGFSYTGTLNIAHVQMEKGTEFTGFVKESLTEEIDFCQGFYETTNSCRGKSDYYPISGTDMFNYHVELIRQKVCTTPRPSVRILYSPSISNINILIDSITDKGFSIEGDITDIGNANIKFVYDCDCDIYRLEELDYLDKQIEWRSGS